MGVRADCHLSPSQAMQYMELIPKEMQPVAGTDGAHYRRRQLVRQLPVHDHDPSQCRGLAEGEAKLMEDFVKKYKAEALGVGEVALPGQAGNAKEEGKAKDAGPAAEKPPETSNGALESMPTTGLYVSPAWRDGGCWGDSWEMGAREVLVGAAHASFASLLPLIVMEAGDARWHLQVCGVALRGPGVPLYPSRQQGRAVCPPWQLIPGEPARWAKAYSPLCCENKQVPLGILGSSERLNMICSQVMGCK